MIPARVPGINLTYPIFWIFPDDAGLFTYGPGDDPGKPQKVMDPVIIAKGRN